VKSWGLVNQTLTCLPLRDRESRERTFARKQQIIYIVNTVREQVQGWGKENEDHRKRKQLLESMVDGRQAKDVVVLDRIRR
jgi:hypothetical protein